MRLERLIAIVVLGVLVPGTAFSKSATEQHRESVGALSGIAGTGYGLDLGHFYYGSPDAETRQSPWRLDQSLPGCWLGLMDRHQVAHRGVVADDNKGTIEIGFAGSRHHVSGEARTEHFMGRHRYTHLGKPGTAVKLKPPIKFIGAKSGFDSRALVLHMQAADDDPYEPPMTPPIGWPVPWPEDEPLPV